MSFLELTYSVSFQNKAGALAEGHCSPENSGNHLHVSLHTSCASQSQGQGCPPPGSNGATITSEKQMRPHSHLEWRQTGGSLLFHRVCSHLSAQFSTFTAHLKKTRFYTGRMRGKLSDAILWYVKAHYFYIWKICNKMGFH